MSLKNLFEKKSKPIGKTDLKNLAADVESEDYILVRNKRIERFAPKIDYIDPANFAKFGLAERYYRDSIQRIHQTFPYDGSEYEKEAWHLSSSHLDNELLRSEYPRANGYARLSATGWGNQASTVDSYGLPAVADLEYIYIKGGPHADPYENFKSENSLANIYESASYRESNLKIGGKRGNTVEFWMKKDAYDVSKTNKEVFFDAWVSGSTVGTDSYGRLRVEANFNTSNATPFNVVYQSGSVGIYNKPIGDSTLRRTDIADGKWHHYAFSFKHSSADSTLYYRLYIDGALNDSREAVTMPSFGSVDGNIVATIGSLTTLHTTGSSSSIGSGKLSGSMDEFRFWKTERDAKEIGSHWLNHAPCGTNNITQNTNLGVYYKFNEGITEISATDATVLDYSGRISNGSWKNYTSASRATGSAFVESGKALREYKDPIIYATHPEVVALLEKKELVGRSYDLQNNSSLYHSLPTWIIEEQMGENKEVNLMGELIQVMSSYFDTLYLQIEALPSLTSQEYKDYASPSHVSGSTFAPFSDKLLKSVGFVTPELFADSVLVEKIASKNDDGAFEFDLHDVKNFIYRNIYNNISQIYKTKGTEKSFRNLIRCFGIDNELIKLNMYADNYTYSFKDNFLNKAEKTRCIDFDDKTRYSATVCQEYLSVTSSYGFASHYISGSGASDDSNLATTMEAEVIFPRKKDSTSHFFEETAFVSSSIFGCHTPSLTPGTMTWDADDNASLQVYAVRENPYSRAAYFILSSTNDGIFNGDSELKSPLIENVYNETKWNISVRLKPRGYPLNNVTGSQDESSTAYDIEFRGTYLILDSIEDSFSVSSPMAKSTAVNFHYAPKSVYAGAHKTNFKGALITSSDVTLSAVRYWQAYLTDEELNDHSRDMTSHGRRHPLREEYVHESGIRTSNHPSYESLALHWDFSQVSGSNAQGKFFVHDASSGSVESASQLHNITRTSHPAFGHGFPESSADVVSGKVISSVRANLPENVYSSDMIATPSADSEVFKPDSRPVNYFIAFEKSMYQTISEEMINFFATIKDFNNLIGEPVNKYRQEYKHLQKIREMFFRRVGNTPDLEKYVEYYKWFDSAISVMIDQLKPATTRFSEDIRTMIESHILERSKYMAKFPTLEIKQSEKDYSFRSIGENQYNWRTGHAPLPESPINDKVNCSWWYEKADRRDTYIFHPSGSAPQEVMRNREKINISATSDFVSGSSYEARRFSKPYRFSMERGIDLSVGYNHNTNKIHDFYKGIIEFDTGRYIMLAAQDINKPASATCAESMPNKKERYRGKTIAKNASGYMNADSDISMPFTLYKTDVITGYNALLRSVKPDLDITNLHADTYGNDMSTPLQGVFAEAHVGGNAHRHNEINVNTPAARIEAYKLNMTSADASATLTVADGTDATANQFTEREQITIISTDGTSRTYVLVDASESGAVATGTILVKGSDTGASVMTSGHALLGGIAVNSNLNTHNQAQVLNEIRTAILHSNGHTGKITCSAVLTPATGTQVITLTQALKGHEGNTSIKTDISQITAVDFAGGYSNIKVVHQDIRLPRASCTRDGTTKRPYNFQNIKTLTGSLIHGNYEKDYEIVQTTGRRQNNSSFTDAGGFSSAVNSIFDGFADIAKTQRGRSEHVFVNRFSAPGGPETSGDSDGGYGLDMESAEYSIYNSMNYRNSIVRNTLNEIQSEPSNQFGARSGSAISEGSYGLKAGSDIGMASMHMTNRNPLYHTDNKKTYDNFFVQHQIPQNDLQYRWISASSLETYNTYPGHSHGFSIPVGDSTVSSYPSSMTFLSSSEVGSHRFTYSGTEFKHSFGAQLSTNFTVVSRTFIPTDFVGMNTIIYEPVSPNTALIRITIPDGDDDTADQFGERESMTLTSTDGTKKTYVVVNSNESLENSLRTGTVLKATTDTGAQGPLGEGSSLIGAIAVRCALSTITQTDLLKEFAKAMTHKNGHKGKLALGDPTSSGGVDGPQTMTIRQVQPGAAGNTSIITDISQISSTGVPDSMKFAGGTDDLNTLGYPLGMTAENFGGTFLNVDNNYINERICQVGNYQPEADNSAHPEGTAAVLNSIILNRQGPHGWPSWKQLRSGDHPVMREHRRNNIFSVQSRNGIANASTYSQYRYPHSSSPYAEERKNDRVITNFVETPVTSRYKPLEIGFGNLSGEKLTYVEGLGDVRWSKNYTTPDMFRRGSYNATAKISYSNNSSGFANSLLSSHMNIEPQNKKIYLEIHQAMLDGNVVPSSILYSEVVYPREDNAFLNKTRNRTAFYNNFWRLSKVDRKKNLTQDFLNSYGFYAAYSITIAQGGDGDETWGHVTSSVWPLDSRNNFSFTRPRKIEDGYSNISYSDDAPDAPAQETWIKTNSDVANRSEGELMNDYSIFHCGKGYTKTAPRNATFEQCSRWKLSTISSPLYSRRFPIEYGDYSYLGGESEWEAGDQAGKYPFYDSYENYREELRGAAQDYSLIPEFRISENIKDIFESGGNFASPRDDFLSLTGSKSGDSSNGKFFSDYSNTDFLKYFEIVRDKSTELGNMSPRRLWLKCNAIMKFLPYNGFYPALRATELAKMWSDELTGLGASDNTSNASSDYRLSRLTNMRNLATPSLFSPGIMFNSIKSGIAADYPIFENKGYGNLTANTSSIDTAYWYSWGMFSASAGAGVASALINSTSSIQNRLATGQPHQYGSAFIGSKIFDARMGATNAGADGGSSHFGNGTTYKYVPRISSSACSRIPFEAIISPDIMKGTILYDNEPHPSASWGVQKCLDGNASQVASYFDLFPKYGQVGKPSEFDPLRLTGGSTWKDIQDDGKVFQDTQTPAYSLASSNFFAETINFFLKGNSLSSMISKPGPFRFASSQTATKAAAYITVKKAQSDMPAAVHGRKFRLYQTDGTGTTFSFATNSASNVANVIGIQSKSASAIATAIAAAINSEMSGITATASSATVTLEQDVVGSAGNTDVTDGSEALAKNLVYSWGREAYAFDGVSLECTGRFKGGRSEFQAYKMRFNVINRGIVMYDNKSAYGPPVDNANPLFSGNQFDINSQDFDFDPYVPSVTKEGSESYIEYSFTPSKQVHTLKEVLEGLEKVYSDNTISNAFSGKYGGCSTNKDFRMNLESSFNMYGVITDPVVEQGTAGNIQRIRTAGNADIRQRWAIQPKWESPILNFRDVTSKKVPLTGQLTASCSTQHPWKINLAEVGLFNGNHYIPSSRGMWHQYGRLPLEQEGYFMSTTDVSGYKSLSDVVGFPTGNQIRMGELPEDGERELCEAVVAIPYVVSDSNPESPEFFELPKTALAQGPSFVRKDPAILHQFDMMKKYNFPPQFDFIKYPEKIPLAMYVFEFTHKLARQDISDIWQNLPPKIGVSAHGWAEGDRRGIDVTEKVVGHTLLDNDGVVDPLGGDIREKLRWMVFKVKKRAETNYFKKIEDSFLKGKPEATVDIFKQERRRRLVSATIDDLDNKFKNSFNWPYDFFSLVELIKLTAEVELK